MNWELADPSHIRKRFAEKWVKIVGVENIYRTLSLFATSTAGGAQQPIACSYVVDTLNGIFECDTYDSLGNALQLFD